MSFASDSKKLLFIHVHRTGGTTMRGIFKDALPDLRQLGNGHLPFWEVMASGDAAAIYESFAVVRHPVEWLVSLYKYVGWPLAGHQDQEVVSKLNFSEFLYWLVEVGLPRGGGVYRRQSDFVAGVDHLIPFEHLEAAWSCEFKRLGLPWPAEVPQKLSTAELPDVRLLVDDFCYIGKHFAEDVTLYRKSLKGWD